GEGEEWYWSCIGGVIVFIATIFLMRGRWSPMAARADQAAHDAAVARELHALPNGLGGPLRSAVDRLRTQLCWHREGGRHHGHRGLAAEPGPRKVRGGLP